MEPEDPVQPEDPLVPVPPGERDALPQGGPEVAVAEPAPIDPAAPDLPDPPDLEATAELLDRLSDELDAVEATLARLATDAAGKCEVCGADIPVEVLRERPLTARCASHDGQPPDYQADPTSSN